jgi:hypothetical protein
MASPRRAAPPLTRLRGPDASSEQPPPQLQLQAQAPGGAAAAVSRKRRAPPPLRRDHRAKPGIQPPRLHRTRDADSETSSGARPLSLAGGTAIRAPPQHKSSLESGHARERAVSVGARTPPRLRVQTWSAGAAGAHSSQRHDAVAQNRTVAPVVLAAREVTGGDPAALNRTSTQHLSTADEIDEEDWALQRNISTGSAILDRTPSKTPRGAVQEEATQEHDVMDKRVDSAVCKVLVAFLVVVLSMISVYIIVWGSASAADCGGLSCSSCAQESDCTWCPGPHPALPGYCEQVSLSSDATCGEPTAAQCSAEDSKEERWSSCKAQSEELQCSNPSISNDVCEWCGTSCLPFFGTNMSFCNPDRLVFGSDRPFALSARTPGCATNSPDGGAATHPTHIDRSGLVATEAAGNPQPLAVNSSYMEGLTCEWVIECPFNTTVEVRFKQVNMGAADELHIFDGWETGGGGLLGTQLAYFKDYAGDRSSGLARTYAGEATSVSGGPSSRLLRSSSSLLSMRLTTGSSDARRKYSEEHAGVPFHAELRYEGFSLTHRCVVPTPSFTYAGAALLGLWWVLAAWSLSHAYKRICYGAKSGGLWKMDVDGLTSIAKAMALANDGDLDGDGETDKSELITAITQSKEWPHHQNGLALSSFETISGDEVPSAWIEVSTLSPTFLMDFVACSACIFEGFFDIFFITLQFQRPNDAGLRTGWLALGITIVSTLIHLSPPGKGILSSTVLQRVRPFAEAKDWVQKNARTERGRPLRSKQDWAAWLLLPAGRHRPSDIPSSPDVQYRRKIGQSTLDAAWVSWGDFLGVADADPDGDQSVARIASRSSALQAALSLSSPETLDRVQHAEQQPILEAGWMDKQGGVRRAWRNRYFELRGDIMFYRDDVGGKIKGVVDLAEAVDVRPSQEVGRRQWEMEIVLPQRQFRLECETQEDLARWLRALAKYSKDPQKLTDWEPELGVDTATPSPPGWLCGQPAQNRWDSDAGQVLYGRVSTKMMFLLSILQLRVPVEGIIAWRNVRTLKSKPVEYDKETCGGRFWAMLNRLGMDTIMVRCEDLDRARSELDKALLREAIFEILPQAVLEFQNLWCAYMSSLSTACAISRGVKALLNHTALLVHCTSCRADEYAVLDLMSVPGLPILTSISEYQVRAQTNAAFYGENLSYREKRRTSSLK